MLLGAIDNAGANGVRINVSRIVVHPEYDLDTRQNDIGLVKLVERVQFSALIRPACLSGAELSPDAEQLVGWSYPSDDKPCNGLLKVWNRVKAHEECSVDFDKLRYEPKGFIDQRTHVCVVPVGDADQCAVCLFRSVKLFNLIINHLLIGLAEKWRFIAIAAFAIQLHV